MAAPRAGDQARRRLARGGHLGAYRGRLHRRYDRRRTRRGAADGVHGPRARCRRDRGAHRGDGPFRRCPDLSARVRNGSRQALVGRRRRHRLAHRRAARCGVRGRGRKTLGACAGPHRRHARQARSDPRRPHRSLARRVRRASRTDRLCDRRAIGSARPGRPQTLRAARPHGHRAVHRPHRSVDRFEEGRRRRRRDRARRQSGTRCVHGRSRNARSSSTLF